MSTDLHDNLFELSPIAILCEDWSHVRRAVLKVVEGGITDFAEYLRANPQFISEVRKDHSIVDANPAALHILGVESTAELVRSASTLLPADPASNSRVLCAIANGSRSCFGERQLNLENGRTIPILWRCTLPENEEGFERLYFFAVDITEEKRAEEALHNAQSDLVHSSRLSLVGELTASVAHELAQPVGAIAAYAATAKRWLSHENPVVSEALAVIQRIEHSSRHADEVLRRIQDFSRRDSPDRVLVSAHDVIHQSLALIDHEVRRSRARLLVDVPAKGCQVFGNCTQVQQLIVNIVVNALQAIAGSNAPERNVFITARRDDQGHVVFKFRDSGPGVPRDVASQIFEPFFSTKADGVGLGLSICRRIVDEHGGQLWTEPTATGATFCFSLPSAGS